MSEDKRRSIILYTNRFQKLILYPILVFSLIATVMIYLCLEYNIRISINPKESMILIFDAAQLREAVPYMLIGVAFMLMCVIMWTYYISHRIVGPHNRIIVELDEIIKGTRTEPLSVRKDDKMFSELIDRINTLIKK